MDIKIAIKHLRRSFSSALLPLPSPSCMQRRKVATILF